ncbi:hypothetical protein [Kitasatospora nipponensis]
MYLVHLRLMVPPDATVPLERVRQLIRVSALPYERVEHVAAHQHAPGRLVVGVYLLADRLEEAEVRAAGLCVRVLAAAPELDCWRLESASVPLVVPFYQRLLSSSDDGGRIGPGPFPSS